MRATAAKSCWSGGVALFDQPAGVVEYFLHEVLVHAAANPAGEVVTRHRPVAVRHLEITAVVVDRQRGPSTGTGSGGWGN